MSNNIKIGIIQLRGAGDSLIAVPIAKWLYKKGMDVDWVIDEKFYEAFKYAVPYVNFHPLSVEEKTIQSNIRNPYWFETPREMLMNAGCQEIICFPYEETLHFDKIGLPSRIIDPVAIRAKDLRLAFHTTFDQFKYAVCNVPFGEKWNLDIRRNMKREDRPTMSGLGICGDNSSRTNISLQIDEQITYRQPHPGIGYLDCTSTSHYLSPVTPSVEVCLLKEPPVIDGSV